MLRMSLLTLFYEKIPCLYVDGVPHQRPDPELEHLDKCQVWSMRATLEQNRRSSPETFFPWSPVGQGPIQGQGKEGPFSVTQGMEVPLEMPRLLLWPRPNPCIDSNRPERLKDCPRSPMELAFCMAATIPCPSLSFLSWGWRCIHCRYCGHFRKDSRLYSYRRAGRSPKPYNLLPHPKGRPFILL